MDASSNLVLEYLERLRQQRDHDQEAYRVPQEPPEFDRSHLRNYHLHDKPSQLKPLQTAKSIESVRQEMREHILEYAERADYDGKLLLIRVPPGIGKTTIAVQCAQEIKGRILYATPRHDFFGDVLNVQGMAQDKWYHWQPLQKADDDGNYEMCRYADEMTSWLNRGYRGVDLCRQVCTYDRHMQNCPYRMQVKRKEKIIFGMHGHLITGMSISDYSVGFCDEMPISAFLKRKWIPRNEILVPGAVGAIGNLFGQLSAIANGNLGVVYGKRLMELLGGILEEAYREVDAGEDVLQAVPSLYTPEEVYNVPYWYVYDLLRLLSPEYECFKAGWDNWISRVRVSRDGILLLSRFYAKEAWKGNKDGSPPKKLICLDATGSPEMYQRLFERPVEVYSPTVERPGHLYQVVGRLNGTGTVFRKTKNGGTSLTKQGEQMLDAAELIKKQYGGKHVAVVTFKGAEQRAEEKFGHGNVRHFGALRGTNDLESADALIVCGGYCPPMSGIFDLAAALHPDRMQPFYDGETPPWTVKEVEYRMRVPGKLGKWRSVAGFWTDPDLAVVLEEYRRWELVQALHRVRPNIKASDVWLLTSIPTGEPLDAIYETLSEVDFTPQRVKMMTKTGVEYYKGITWEIWIKLRSWLEEKRNKAEEEWNETLKKLVEEGEVTEEELADWKRKGRLEEELAEELEEWRRKNGLTKENLADHGGVKVGTVGSQQWIRCLDAFLEGWEIREDRESGRSGRPSLYLVPRLK